MKRIFVLITIAGSLTFLTGCQSDKKQAADIHEKMEESAAFEEEFASYQNDLAENREKVQEGYNDLISLDIQDADAIKQRVEDLKIYMGNEQVDKAEENFRNAYNTSMSIEENIKLIKDEDQQKQATKLMTLMNKRKKLMDSFFDTYRDQLTLQNSFFDSLEQGEFELDTLDEQIHTINEDSQNMMDVIQKFNQYTKQYNEIENDYFKMAELS